MDVANDVGVAAARIAIEPELRGEAVDGARADGDPYRRFVLSRRAPPNREGGGEPAGVEIHVDLTAVSAR